ncbi:tetratricopeptide repeat protein [Flavobacterium amniphilum]|nr:tetratricopeptide repeat protein [Flavobacterium amniphilum]MCL9805924.1 tetratricopeptide repeat protein [Flavobacterium amniphilum]
MKSVFKIVFLLLFVGTFAQQKKDFALPEANEQFAKKQFAEAEANYRVSKAINGKRATSSYNLGNAIYKQNQPSEAKYAYAKAIESAKGKQQKHNAFHNIGNVFMKEKAYDKAVEAYKNALRNNPSDEETRYNYALAKKMLKDNPPKGDDKKDDKKDKNKDKNKDQNKDQKDKKDQNNQNKDQKKPEENKQDKPKPKPGNVPKDRLQNLLDAVNNEEKKIQDKVNARKVKGQPVEEGKDW